VKADKRQQTVLNLDQVCVAPHPLGGEISLAWLGSRLAIEYLFE
jgi:hypothetical protein